MSDLVFYTSAEVAELLRLNLQVVQRKLQSGEIPGYRLGRDWRIERAQLMSWLERHSNQTPGTRDPAAAWFEADGRLRALPAARQKRGPVLARLAERFEQGRTYAEAEVNTVLREVHDDVATLRRELVAEKLLVRTKAGVYKRTAPRGAALSRA